MTIQAPSKETREAYQAKVQAQLDKIDAQLKEYQAKADQAKVEAAVSYHSHVEELMTKRDAAERKLDELGKAGEAAWQDVQKGFESAWNELTRSFARASEQFSR